MSQMHVATDVELSFAENWALFRLTIPSSDLWFKERESLFYGALLGEMNSANRREYVCRTRRMSESDFDELLCEVADRLLPRFHIAAKSLYDFTAEYMAIRFHEARTRQWRRQGREKPFALGNGEDSSDRHDTAELVPQLLDLIDVVGWSWDEIDILACVVFGNVSPAAAVTEMDEIRRKFVGLVDSTTADSVRTKYQTTLDMYLKGMSQEEIAEQLHVGLATVNGQIRKATRAVGNRFEKGSDVRAKTIHQFVKTWHNRAANKPAAGSRKKPSTPDTHGTQWRCRWEDYYTELKCELATSGLPLRVAELAPLQSLVALIKTVSRETGHGVDEVKQALANINAVSLRILRPSP